MNAADRTSLPPNDRRAARLRSVLLIITVLLLAGAAVQTAVLEHQARQVRLAVEATGDEFDIDALVQAQTTAHLVHVQLIDRNAGSDITALSASIGRRLHAATLRDGFGEIDDPDLLMRIAALDEAWSTDVLPVFQALDTMPDDAELIDTAAVRVRDFERELNDVINATDHERTATALAARAAALDLLHTNRITDLGMMLGVIGVVAAMAIATILFRRHDAERDRHHAELLDAVDEARTLSLVASRSSNMVLILDARGRVEWVNDAFVRISGYSREEVQDRKPSAFLRGPQTDDDVRRRIGRRIRAAEPFHTQIVNYTRDGNTFWVESDGQPVFDDNGEITRYIIVQTDVTEQKLAAEHLQQTRDAAEDLARAKSYFLASMSHEIRTPLNALLGLTELLLETDLDPEQREFATTAHSSGQLLLEILNNILDFSALEAGRIEFDTQHFDPRRLVRRVADTLGSDAERRRLAFRIDIHDSVPLALVGDQARLQQILVNIVSNAIKFTETGGVEVEVEWSGECIEITVSDTGIGIPTDRVDRLFQPFSQANRSISQRFGGTGLGLAISKHLADMLGGHLTIESVEHEGTTARLSAPMSVGSPELVPSELSDVPITHTDATPRILVAEDDPINQRVTLHMLNRLGYKADLVPNGREAVDACVAHRYDLVLMDVHMPELDGVDATREIRRRLLPDRQPRIIALTASAMVGDREQFLEAGMDSYLSKPVQLRCLADAIDQLLSVRHPTTPGSSGHPTVGADSV